MVSPNELENLAKGKELEVRRQQEKVFELISSIREYHNASSQLI